MNNKILLIILVILVAIYAFTKFNSNEEREFNFFAVDSVDVAKIEMSQNGEKIVLAKSDDVWKLVEPLESKIEKRNLENIFSRALVVTTSEIPVSEKESAREIYNLTDSLATVVKIYDKSGKLLSDVLLGKSKQWNNTPARKNGDNKIYRLNSNISRIFNTDKDYWRDKEVLYVFPEQIQELQLLADDLDYKVTATDSLWKVEYRNQVINVDENNDFLSSVFKNLKKVKVAKFYYDDYSKVADKFENPEFKIIIKKRSGDVITLTFVESDQSQYRLMKINDNEDQLYYMSNWWSDKFIQRVKLI
jgi:hypothetical protein